MGTKTRAAAAALLMATCMDAHATATAISAFDWRAMTVTSTNGLSVEFEPIEYWHGTGTWDWHGEPTGARTVVDSGSSNHGSFFSSALNVTGTGTATVTVPYQLTATTTVEYEAPLWRMESASAFLGMYLYLPDVTYQTYTYNVSAANDTNSGNAVKTGTLTFLLTGSGAPLQYSFWGNHHTLAYSAPVPESETYAMILVGLGALGLVRCQKRRRGVVVKYFWTLR